MDAITDAWIRNPSDERAVANGCRFNVERGSHAIWWIERHCKLYEGDQQGEPLSLCGCHQCEPFGEAPDAWNGNTIERYAKRADKHCACVAAGHHIDWQYECLMRIFGWEKFSDEWKRHLRRFKRGGIWVAKKNKKTPTMSAVGMYLLCGDGEPGNKVFLGAKDGQQVRDNAAKHLVEMYERSPEIREECELNRNLMQITHNPSRSIIKPLSSSNERTKKSKEGLNGSLLIDETHVVDRDFIKRISRAGISRAEPLHLEFSTAGDDPESYGKEQFDKGRKVESGEDVNESYFFAGYFAPQDLLDADLAADPVKYGKMANPAWGHTIKQTEYLEDYENSRSSLTDLADFKMYRLNIWQASANPWLRMGDWQANERAYTHTDLLGMTCFGGLDLAKTRDTTALSLLFPGESGTYRVLVYYWLPEARAAELRNDVKYHQWARENWVELTPGNVCDYGYVRNRVNEIRQLFNLQKIGFDGTYAAQLMQRLVEEDGMSSDTQEEFPQTMLAFTGAMSAMERLVINGKLHHNGNPVLTWQAGNTCAKRDNNENIRPVKDKKGSVRTIDGPVATIMGLGMALKYGHIGEGGMEVW